MSERRCQVTTASVWSQRAFAPVKDEIAFGRLPTYFDRLNHSKTRLRRGFLHERAVVANRYFITDCVFDAV